MKQNHIIFHYFLYNLIFCLSVGLLIGVLSLDSEEVNNPTLDSTLPVTDNISSKAEAEEVLIKPSEVDQLSEVTESIFTEISSEAIEGINEIINNDTPIVFSHVDAATDELQKRSNIASALPIDDEIPDKETINATNIVLESEEDRSANNETEETDAAPPKNVTEKISEDIPSFSEWAQKHLEEAEKKEQVNSSTPNSTFNGTKQSSGGKIRWNNYASVDCGAKVVLANPEAQHTWAILVGSRDEYMLNLCNSRIWFVVELCEAIQLKKIELANYELFSSSPKEFALSVSDRFPTRDWTSVGVFTALPPKEERGVQSFDVNTESFGKYVKVEFKSHYGSEHYCPLSLFRAYGMSVFEVLQKDDPTHVQRSEDDDDDDDDGSLGRLVKEEKPGNLLSSATDAVLSMVKKAAQVLGNKVNKTNEASQAGNLSKLYSPIIKSCSSPSHYVVCNNCSDTLFGKIYELLSCTQQQIKNLVSIPFINRALVNSAICQPFGFDFRDKSASLSTYAEANSVNSFFPAFFLGAMCNSLAITYNKVLYNVSHQYANVTEQKPGENLINVDQVDIKASIKDDEHRETIGEKTDKFSEQVKLENLDIIGSKAGCSTDTTYMPTKAQITELPGNQENLGTPTQQPLEPVENTNASDSEVDPDIPAEAELQSESVTEENVDKLINELNTEASQPVVNPPSTSNLQGPKESVFLRLSNRIKALERNMSLSSQYLEELSKRYKKQVEEMQRVLDKTEYTLNHVTSKMEERHKQLEERLESLTRAMENLSAEKRNWSDFTYWLFFGAGLIFLCYSYKRFSTPSAHVNAAKPVEIHRRNSVDVVRATSKKKKRRPSDQALKIVTSASGDQEKHPRKRKKKSSNPENCCLEADKFMPACTSSKIWSKPTSQDWVESRGRVIENIPFPLEEGDSFTLESKPVVPDVSTIDAPVFIKTAANFRLARSNSLKNGAARPASPVQSLNGSISSSNQPSPKKERKGFKKLFKKVF
ncbi:SUN domain-containing ossification factor isoform X2 [Anthonomus grandis grandis]|uniref:SUN domain-containing ossification factor isoform X2 n=1 Tax=Anthonomus grandis grandis TaxID=2921223 RepID=UPI00216545C1|nr:SUN domain-containing ossification factor isoform X2 [Anthonomus grandis grandis]